MTKAGFWSTDWFLGLAVSLVFLFAGGSRLIEGLERSAYEWGVNATSRVPSDKVAVIAIDDVSIANIGCWPWPRDKLARIIDMLAGAKAKVIANEHAPDILKYNPSLPPAFVAFLDMAMAKEAEQRYQTGDEFAAALRTIFGARAPGGTGARVDISL